MGWIALINIALIILLAIGIVITQSPMCLMCLFFLRDMTPQPVFMRMPSDDEEGQPMGFTAKL